MRHRYLIILALAALCFVGCGNSDKNTEPEWVTRLDEMSSYMQGDTLIDTYFKYNQIINGYEVTGRWRPFNKECEIGPVLMNFRNIETGDEFQYFNPRYRSYDTDNVTYSKGFKGHQKGDIHFFDYAYHGLFECFRKRNQNLFDGHSSPFQFLDIDFDGKDEFIASDYYTGEVGLNYEVYEITENGLERIDYIPLNNISCIDRIDLEKKTITIVSFDGVCDNVEFHFSHKKRRDKITEMPKFYTESASRFDFEKYNDELGCPFVLDSINENVFGSDDHHATYKVCGGKIVKV